MKEYTSGRPVTRGVRREPSPEVDALARAVIGAAIEVHRVLGPGFMEGIYEEALCTELELRGIPFVRQPLVIVEYKSREAGESRPDLLVGGTLVVELKAVDQLAPIHVAQLMSYLKAARCELGLLINFNVTLLKSGVKRVVHS